MMLKPTSVLKPIRILIADDHPLIRTALKAVINAEPHMVVISEASDGVEAVEQFFKLLPDIALMDLAMPRKDGLEAIHEILGVYPTARIIVLTNSDSDEDVYQGLEAGAMGYILKDTRHEELLGVIRYVHSGKKYIPAKLAERLAQRRFQPVVSDREMQVLRGMMAGKSNKAIGYELGIAESTVKSHIKSILLKLNVADRTQAVTEALRRGILQSK